VINYDGVPCQIHMIADQKCSDNCCLFLRKWVEVVAIIYFFDFFIFYFLFLYMYEKEKRTKYILDVVSHALLQGYHSLQVHRVAHALWSQGRKVLALALQSRISEVVLYFLV